MSIAHILVYRTKHVDIDKHFIKEMIDKQECTGDISSNKTKRGGYPHKESSQIKF